MLSNDKWAKYELQSLTVKEIVNKYNVILPVWLDITEDDLKDKCFWLLDKKAIKASDGIDTVVKNILTVVK